MMEIIDGLAQVYKPEGVGVWLLNPHGQLGGRSPWQVIREDVDGLERIHGQVLALLDGVFV